MGYNKTTWADRNVQFPSRYTDELNNVKTFTPNPGTIIDAGTKATAARMNNIEIAVEATHKGTHIYGASATGNDSYVVSFTTPFLAYNAGMTINFKVDVGNTGAATINVDSLGAKNLKRVISTGKTDLITGDLIANMIYTAIYDGTDFIITNPLLAAGKITAAGDILYGDAAGSLAKLAKGTAYQVLTMASDASLPQWANPEWKKIATITLSVDTQKVDFNSIPYSSYKLFKIKFMGCGNSSADLAIRIDDVSTASFYDYHYFSQNAATTISGVSTTGTSAILGPVPIASPFADLAYSELILKMYTSNSYFYSKGYGITMGSNIYFGYFSSNGTSGKSSASKISIMSSNGTSNYIAGSRFELWGANI